MNPEIVQNLFLRPRDLKQANDRNPPQPVA
jgi:hypothetical protein